MTEPATLQYQIECLQNDIATLEQENRQLRARNERLETTLVEVHRLAEQLVQGLMNRSA